MTLQELMSFKKGSKFNYNGRECEVIWVENLVEYFKIKDHEGKFHEYNRKNFSMCFGLPSGQVITLSSSFPTPKNLNLPEYSL
jgi:hypothetical protein